MPLEVFDYRRDIKNVVITPEIRARFQRFEPGDVATRHSHDLGAEVFLIMQGRAEFEIEGETAVLGPGELCFADRDELHQVRVIGDEPVIMYLSVTPHVEPTHTMYAEDGSRLPPAYGHSTSEERAAHDPSAGGLHGGPCPGALPGIAGAGPPRPRDRRPPRRAHGRNRATGRGRR